LNDQHLVVVMQIYVQNLQLLGYQQHINTIIGTIHRYLINKLSSTYFHK
jgi:hypothetical protein